MMNVCSPAATLRKLRRFNSWFDGFGPEPPAGRPTLSVAVSGYLRDESGWGAAARGYVRALLRLGVPTALEDFSALTSNRSQDRSVPAGEQLERVDVNLVCIDAGQHFAALSQVGERFFEGRYNIGAWAWELPTFPERWYDRFAYYDEIWVGTSFVASALAPISPVPIVRLPPVLMPQTFGSRARGRADWGLREDEFTFLFVFDVHSHLARKNPTAIVDAFCRAFGPSEPVRLFLKCVNAESDPEGFAALQAAAEGWPITISSGYAPVERLRDLMAACDAYVSLHRAEGIGLTIADAMALGKPVIATDWSGNTDFLDASTGFPVSYRLVELDGNVGPYPAGDVWAEPSVEHAAQLMRFVVDHPAEARVRGQQASLALARDYSEERIAELLQRRLAVIADRHDYDVFKRGVRALVGGYHDLVRDVRQIVERVVPPGSAVMVVSKGDQALIEFGERTGCHFPETPSGVYAGFHPRDGAAAVDLLEVSIAKGREYLLFPGTALWWLDHYTELRRYLDARGERLWADRRCVLYRLHSPAPPMAEAKP
jgi:glycosyltransferase involved in cell wall biosynthesis